MSGSADDPPVTPNPITPAANGAKKDTIMETTNSSLSSENQAVAEFGPYTWAVRLAEGTGGGARCAAMLVLSLFNGCDFPYSLRECLQSLDDSNTEKALTAVTHFFARREDDFLVSAGYAVVKRWGDKLERSS